MTPDPLEERNVYVNESNYDPGKQGLYAKVDIEPQSIFAYFGGHVYPIAKFNFSQIFAPRYFTKIKDGYQEFIGNINTRIKSWLITIIPIYSVHIPDEFGDDISKYNATLGHKIRHSFQDSNCYFVTNNHPRFGVIAAAKSSKKIEAGSEILCHYGLQFHEYDLKYQEIWRVELEKDTPEGPFGLRGRKKGQGLPIEAMLADSDLYKKFLIHATEHLKLDHLT